MKHLILIVLYSAFSSCLFSQNKAGILTQINGDVGFGKDWKLNAKLEGRQLFLQQPRPRGKSQAEFERADLELVANYSVGPGTAVGGGYLLRREAGSYIHRFIQQFSLTQKLYGSRLSHRIRTDQTFESGEPIQLRLRYRLSWEKPLSGLQVDTKEFYLKLNNEYFGLLQGGKGDVEVRFLTNLGYSIGDNNKIEAGIDYRLEKIIQSTEDLLFLQVAFYHSF